MPPTRAAAVFRFRVALGVFWIGLVLSGVTAFPLLHELRLLVSLLDLEHGGGGLFGSAFGEWILRVKNGLEDVHRNQPWMAYGTDWLAFGHLMIALFFVEPWLRPIGSRGVLRTGVIACLLVIPTALICGQVRGIPLGWRFIDCSFGIGGLPPLLYCLRQLDHIEAAEAPRN